MPVRSTTSEYQPSPPISRLRNPAGKLANVLAIRQGTTTGAGTKPNMGVPPATNGERAMGTVTASQPASATKQMKMSPTVG